MPEPSGFGQRVPPHNLEAEQSVLGSMMLSKDAVDIAAEALTASDFSRGGHALIFEAACSLRDDGVGVDALSVADRLDLAGKLERAGDKAYLLDITNTVPTSANVKHYAAIVKRTAQLRLLIKTGTFITQMGYEPSEDTVDELVGRAMNAIMGLAVSAKTGGRSVGKAFTDLLKELRAGGREFVSPPYLDYVHVRPGDVVILAAGTSVGKTLTSLEWADAWSQLYSTLYLEYEMNEESLAGRMAAKYTRVSLTQMDEDLTKEEIDQLEKVGSRVLASRQLYVEAISTGGTGALFAKIRKAAAVGVKIVFIDHLGLIPIVVPKGMNHAKAVGSELTNKLKRLARELDIIIVVLAQLNRDGQTRTGKDRHPKKSDLRDSGEIEQDADIIVMLHREANADEDLGASILAREQAALPPEFMDDVLWMGVVKNRNGSLGHTYCGCLPQYNMLFNPYVGTDPFRDVTAYLESLPAAPEPEQETLEV